MNWLNYFQHNRSHRRTVPWERGIHVEPYLCRALIRSLQRFQVGESGEGKHLRRAAATLDDPDYAAAIDLFIREEQEHARLMAEVLKALGAPLLKRHWSDGCFILLRRLFDLQFEVLVLLVPEMIARRYFRAVHDGTRDPVVRAVCAQICHDEEGHLAFHIDTLQRLFAGRSLWFRAMTRVGWRLLFRLACLVVMLDHRSILTRCGVSPARFWWDCGLIFDEVAASVLNYMPRPMLGRRTFLPRIAEI